MNIRFLLAALAFVVTGCNTVPQLAVPLAPDTMKTPATKVAIAMTDLPKVNTQFPGAGCLLCMAAAELNHTALTAHVQKLSYEDLPKLNEQLASVLKGKGHEASLVKVNFDSLPDFKSDKPNFARKDFRGLKKTMNVDKLIVIQVASAGVQRMYSAYIPAGDPKAFIAGTSYMVNLNDNALEWYVPLNVMKASDGAWDEPTAFPGLTNAYYQALEMAKDQVLNPFKL